jgi:hypothetical protein
MLRYDSLVLVVLLGAALGLASPLSTLPMRLVARPEAPPGTGQPPASDFIKGLQRALKRAGYDPGATDGKMGPTTRRALQRFQRAHGLPPTGEADIPTLTQLLGQDLPP